MKRGMMQVQLDQDDLLLAHHVASARRRPNSEARPDADLIGAKGEVAFRLIFLSWFDLGKPKTKYEEDAGWDFDMPDGRTVDVKSISDPKNNLLVPKHVRAGTYVLTLVEDDWVTMLGWISGGRASTCGTIAKWGTHYLVPQDQLASFVSLHSSYDPDHPRGAPRVSIPGPGATQPAPAAAADSCNDPVENDRWLNKTPSSTRPCATPTMAGKSFPSTALREAHARVAGRAATRLGSIPAPSMD